MIRREHMKGDAASAAMYSDCEAYRYVLTRVWDDTERKVNFVMLNPSKATEVQNDPTIERCERRARALGYGGFAVTNIFAWRETSPKALKQAAHPIGAENDAMISEAADWADEIIAAWGAHGEHLERGATVRDLLANCGRPLFHFGLTKAGHPRHPLYIAYAEVPKRWSLS